MYIIIILIFIILLNNTCGEKIEYFKLYNDISFIESDLKYIPSSDTTSTLANNYYIRPNKYLPSTDGFLDSLYRMDPNYYNYMYDFPVENPDVPYKYLKDYNKKYNSMFRKIPTHDTSLEDIYNDNKLKDKYYANDPLSSLYKIGSKHKIITETLPRKHRNVCGEVTCPIDKKIINTKRNYKVFSTNQKDIEKLCCGPL